VPRKQADTNRAMTLACLLSEFANIMFFLLYL